MATPLFSIITVTYNAASVITPTLQSVKAQHFSDFEHLIIDGASKDDTVKIAQNAGIEQLRVLSEPDKGLYDAMNKGLRRATGKYLIFLNAGDAFADGDTLDRLAECAKENPGIIYGQTQLVNAKREVVGMRHLTAPEHLTADSFKRGMLVCHQAFVARKDIVRAYDLAYRFSADYDWCVRCLQKSDKNSYVGDRPIINFLTDGLTDKYHKASLKERFHIMCRHYGTLPTIMRHISFIPRYLAQKLK